MKRPIEIGENLMFLLIVLIITAALLIASVLDSKAQNTVMPTWVADSLIYETFKGRECNNLQASQAEVIKAQGEELLANGTLIKLSGNQIQTLEVMVVNLKDQNKLQSERFSNKEKVTKKKLRKRAVIIVGQAVIITVMVVSSMNN